MKPDVAVYVKRHLFGDDRAEHQASSRQSITEIIETYAADLPPHLISVSINDEPPLEPIKFAGTDQEWSPWDCVRPKPDARVFIRLKAPEGEQGGVGQIAFNIGIALAMVAAIAFLGPAAGPLVAVGIGLAGTMGNYFLFQPPDPPTVEGRETSYSITGVRNQMARIGQVIPYVTKWGENYPLHIAQPYVTTEDGEQYLHALLSPGWGPLRFSDLKIGDTPFESFPELEWETRDGRIGVGETRPALYRLAVFEAAPNVAIRFDAGPVTAVLDDDVTRIEVELTWPEGIWGMSESGESKEQWCKVRVEYRFVGTPGWAVLANDVVISKNIRRTWRQRWVVDVPEGKYEARVTRLNADVPLEDQERYKNEFYWTSFLGKSGKSVLTKNGLALIAIRCKAGPNTEGILDRISCDVARYALDWNGSSWVEALTENPASIYRDICQHRGANRNEIIHDNRLDLPGLQAWHQRCTTADRSFAGVFADQATILERLRNVASAGRASFSPIDTKFGVVEDLERTVPVQTITPHNSRGYAKIQQFRRIPDAIRVSFMDRTAGWVRNEITVYNDGFDAANATIFDDLDVTERGITRPHRAWQEGRYHLAEMIHRPWVAQVEMDLEALVARRGDMIHFAHPAQLLGITTGRIAAVTISGSNVTGVTLESSVVMETGKLYSIRLRTVSTAGAHQALEIAVTTQVGRRTQLTFSAPIAQATLNAQRGDMYVYGERGFVGTDCVVRALTPSSDRTVVVELVPHAQPEINDATSGAIGPYEPGITQPPGQPKAPPKPVLLMVRRDELIPSREPYGITKVQLVAVLAAPPAKSTAATSYQVRYRELGEAAWAGVSAETAGLEVSFIVSFGFIYEVQVQALAFDSGLAITSAWSETATVNAKKITKTIIDVAMVTGLELKGQAHNREFVGRDAHLVWRMTSSSGSKELSDDAGGGVNTFRDPTFSHWLVIVYTGGPTNTEIRREETVTQPEFLYDYDKNYADAALLSPANPVAKVARRFTVDVRIVDTYGRVSAVPATLTVNNPAPALPLGLSVTTNIGTIWVSFTLPADPDWIGMKAWASTVSGFSPGPANLLGKVNANIASFNSFADGSPVLQGTDYFIRVAAFDAFDDIPELLNVSGEFAVRTATVDISDLPQFVFDPVPTYTVALTGGVGGVARLSWSSSTARVTRPVAGTTNSFNISSGFVDYTGLTRYVAYKEGATALTTSTDPAAHTGTDETLMAVWRGGRDLTQFNGKAGIDGAFIYGQTITANALATGVAIITEAAQIAAATINNAHITDLSADKILAGSIFTQTVHVGDNQNGRIDIIGNAVDGVAGGLIEVRDAQLVKRVRIGHLAAGGGAWGLEVRDSVGTLVFRADGMNGVFIDPESISSLKLEIDAVSRHATTLTGAQTTLDAGGGPDNIATAVVTTLPQARTLVWFAADCPGGIAAGATDWQCELSLYRNNTLLKSRTVTGPSAALIWYTFDSSPVSGTNSYEIRGDMSDQQSVQNLVVRQRQLSVLSLIR